MGDNTQHTDIEADIPPVDEAAVKRKSILSGMWSGMKKGMLWGGVAGLATTGIGTAIAFTGAKMVGTTSVGLASNALASLPWLAKIPVVGMPAAMALGGGMAIIGYSAASAGAAAIASPTAAALGFLGMFASTALPVMAITLGVGALIGGVVGAVSGYNDSDNKVEQAHRSAKAQAQQLSFERQQVQKAILQEREMEAQLGRQTEQLYAGNAQQIGNLTPSAPHQKLHDPRMRGFENPVG